MLTLRHLSVMGLAALAASLVGCSAASSREAANDVVTQTNVAEVSRGVEADRSMPRKDRDRFLAFVSDHESSPDAYTGKNVAQIVNLQKAHEVGVRLQMEAEREDRAHRAALARVIDATIAKAPERDRSIDYFVRVKNLTNKAIAHIEFGLEVHDASGKRIGLAEMRSNTRVNARSQRDLEIPMRYVRFGEDAGPMREAAGQPKTYELLVKEIKYTDGSDAGYDD